MQTNLLKRIFRGLLIGGKLPLDESVAESLSFRCGEGKSEENFRKVSKNPQPGRGLVLFNDVQEPKRDRTAKGESPFLAEGNGTRRAFLAQK